MDATCQARAWSEDGKVVLAEAHSTHDVSGCDQGTQDVQVISGGRESLQIFLRTPRGTKIVRVAPHATMQEAVSCIRSDAPGGTWKAHCQAKCIQPGDQLSAHGIRDQDCITITLREPGGGKCDLLDARSTILQVPPTYAHAQGIRQARNNDAEPDPQGISIHIRSSG